MTQRCRCACGPSTQIFVCQASRYFDKRRQSAVHRSRTKQRGVTMAHSTCQRLRIDPEFPEPRLIAHAVTVLERSGVVAYPTDTNYGIGCGIFDKNAIDRVYRLRNLGSDHLLSFICPDLS